jgi:hypothetical protein
MRTMGREMGLDSWAGNEEMFHDQSNNAVNIT